MRYLIVLFIISISFSITHAFDHKGFEQNLSNLEKIVEVKFVANMPFSHRALGARNLVAFLESSTIRSFFGKDAIIKRVIIDDSDERFHDSIKYLQLHVDTIFYHYNGNEDQELNLAIHDFAAIQDSIILLENNLKKEFSNLEFQRELDDLFNHIYSPDVVYLRHLRLLKSLSQREEYNRSLKELKKISFYEKIASIERSSVSRYVNADNEVHLTITVATNEGRGQYIGLDSEEFFRNYLDIVLLNEFQEVRMYGREEEIASAVDNLNRFLTCDHVALLKQNEVELFELSEFWERNEDLLIFGRLILGVTIEDMELALDLLFN